MIANFFTKSKPVNTIVIIVLFLVIYGFSIYTEIIPFSWYTVPFFLFFFGIIGFINRKNNLTFNNLFAFLFLVILIGFFPQVLVINKIFVSNMFLLLFLRKVYSLQSDKNTIGKIFDTSFWLGIAFLIEPFSIVFAILLYTSMFLHNRLNIRTFILPILGFSIPTILYFTYCFWFDSTEKFTKLFYWYSNYDFSLYGNTTVTYGLTFIGCFSIASVFLKTPKIINVKNNFRTSWILLILNSLLALFLVILTDYKNGNEFLYFFFPTSIILANGLEVLQKNKIVDGILILFFISLLIPFLSL